MENLNLSQDEKIDYIYTYVKKEEKRRTIELYLKWGFRIFMLTYIIYFIYFALPGLIDNFKGMLTPNINSINGAGGINPETLDKIKGLLNL